MSDMNAVKAKLVRNFDRIMDKMSDIVLVLNEKREIVYHNKAVLALPLVDQNEVIGNRPGNLFGCVNTEKNKHVCGTTTHCKNCGALKILNDALGGKDTIEDCVVRSNLTGSEHDMHLRIDASPINVNDEELALYVLTDISQLKKGAVLEETFYQLYQNMSNGVAIYRAVDDGKDFVFKSINQAGQKIDDISLSDVVGKRVTEIFPAVKEFGILDVFENVYKTGEPQSHPVKLYDDGRVKGWRENYVFKLPTSEIVAIYKDVTNEKRVEQQLVESKKWLDLILDTVNTGILMINADTLKIDEVNVAGQKLLGYRKEDILGSDFRNFLKHTDFDIKSLDSLLKERDFIEASILDSRMRQVPVLISVNFGKYNKTKYIIVAFFDIAKRKKIEDDLKELTLIDDLTKIGNRRGFDIALNEALNQSIFTSKSLSTIMIDIDYFKSYNDYYGHLKGDDTLKEIAQIIKSMLKRDLDNVYRFGGEEFIVILPNVSLKGAKIVADRIKLEIEQAMIPHEKSPVSDHVTVSMGISSRNLSNQLNEVELINEADRKLYVAKEQGRNQIQH